MFVLFQISGNVPVSIQFLEMTDKGLTTFTMLGGAGTKRFFPLKMLDGAGIKNLL